VRAHVDAPRAKNVCGARPKYCSGYSRSVDVATRGPYPLSSMRHSMPSHHPASAPAQTSASERATILLADDDAGVVQVLSLLLGDFGYRTVSAGTPAAVLDVLRTQAVHAVLIDMNFQRDTTSGDEGLALIRQIRARHPQLPVVAMTGWGDIDLAVRAVRLGAQDFITKPWDEDRLLATIASMTAQRADLVSTTAAHDDAPPVPTSPAMLEILRLIDRVAPSTANILLLGEHGTGKDFTARLIHQRSTRAAKPLVTADLGGLAEGTFESELFGHVAGAFTDAKTARVGRFELAHGGTLFLDEIANITVSQQARLLRVLQTGQIERVGSSRTQRVDVRLIAATNADLDAAVAAGTFRPDLRFRIDTVTLQLPPLRDRTQDIVPLAYFFLRVHAAKYARPTNQFTRAAIDLMLAHRWPGNIRELGHAVERAVLLASGTAIDWTDLRIDNTNSDAPPPPHESLSETERRRIEEVLQRTGRNVQQAAKLLGLSRGALYRRLERYGL